MEDISWQGNCIKNEDANRSRPNSFEVGDIGRKRNDSYRPSPW